MLYRPLWPALGGQFGAHRAPLQLQTDLRKDLSSSNCCALRRTLPSLEQNLHSPVL